MNTTDSNTNDFQWLDASDSNPDHIADFINHEDTPVKHAQNEQLAHKVSAHLASLSHLADVVPVVVTIGRKTYFGAQYRDVSPAITGSPAALYPDRYAEQNRQHEQALHLYLVGKQHHTSVRHNAAYISDQHKGEFFVTGYASQQTADDPRYAQYHPFGAWFGLMQTLDPTFLITPWGTHYPQHNMSIRYLV